MTDTQADCVAVISAEMRGHRTETGWIGIDDVRDWADRLDLLQRQGDAWADLRSTSFGAVYWQTSAPLDRMPLGRYTIAPPAGDKA